MSVYGLKLLSLVSETLDPSTATQGDCLSFRTGSFNLWTINQPLEHLRGKAQEITVSGGMSKQYARLLLLRISGGVLDEVSMD